MHTMRANAETGSRGNPAADDTQQRGQPTAEPADVQAAGAAQEANENAMSVYPLLSGVSMKKGFGVHPGIPGEFTPTDNSISDLSNVLDDMAGKTDNRESIPNPFSQTEAFQITLEVHPEAVTSKAVKAQWRGAMCLALLYPTLFHTRETIPFWKKGNHNPKNQFLNRVDDCKGLHAIEPWALCVNKRKKTFPLLFCSDQCGVVPVAYGIETELCALPWLKPRQAARRPANQAYAIQYFDDPLNVLSLGQLKLLLAGVRQYRNEYRGRNIVAVDSFEADLVIRINAYENKNPYADVEENLILGLLLRNTVDTGLHVVSVQNTNPVCEEANRICRLAESVCADADKLVLLDDQIVAYLDQTDLLCSVCPEQVKKLAGYETLSHLKEKLLSGDQNTDARNRLVQYQIVRLLDHFPNAAGVSSLNRAFESERIYDPMRLPWEPTRALPNEVNLTKGDFYPFGLVAMVEDDPRYLFSDEMVYLESDETLKEEGVLQAMYEIKQDRSRWYYVFRPAGSFGGKALMNHSDVTLDCIVKGHNANLAIEATFKAQYHNMEYVKTQLYSLPQLHPLKMDKLPCIATWADVEESAAPDEKCWRLHYVFVCLPLDVTSSQYDVNAYTLDGRMIDKNNQIGASFKRENLQSWWRNFCLDATPGFLSFTLNRQTVGIIKLKNNPEQIPLRLYRNNVRVKLAIDFGTTSTIAAMRMEPDGIITIPCLEENHITWIMNRAEGQTHATRYFMSSAFYSGGTDKAVILSAIRRFHTAIEQGKRTSDQVHIAGNIFYMVNTTPREDNEFNISSGFKIMLHSNDDTNEDTVLQQTQDTRLFLKQLLHMYMLLCRKNRANHVDIYFATPLALTKDEKQRLIGIFRDTISEVADKAGLDPAKDVSVMIASESRAVGAYFQNYGILTDIDQGGIFVLDIGGGTSDYSFWERGAYNATSFVCCSNRLAGHELLSRYLFTDIAHGSQMGKLLAALDQAQKTANNNRPDAYFASLLNNLKNIKPHTNEAVSMLDRLIDQLFIQYYDDMLAALRDPSCEMLLSVINFQLGLLFWLGHMVFTLIIRKRDKTLQSSNITLCLAGNGANFYRLLPRGRKEALQKVFNSIGAKMSIFQNVERTEQKTEVAKGLLLSEQTAAMEEDDLDNPRTITSAEDMWQNLQAFLEAYCTVFTQPTLQDTIAQELLLILKDDKRLGTIKRFFTENATSIEKLNLTIVYFKNGLLESIRNNILEREIT